MFRKLAPHALIGIISVASLEYWSIVIEANIDLMIQLDERFESV